MDFQYKAFISYSHRDARWAQWLLQALETYRLPETKVRGIGKVFRDRDEAGAASDLKDEIQRALTASEHLIVIASPNSAQSKYVEAEIQAFAAANATREVPGKILTLIVAGEPNAAAGSASAIECFPPALRGGISRPDGSPFEPLAADARQVGDGRTRALAKLVAGLMDIRYDTLVRRDLIRRRRGRVIAIAASIAALVIAGIVGAVVISGNLEQERLRAINESAARETRTVTAVNNAERAGRLLDGGSPAAAQALARSSLPTDGSVPFIPQAYDVVFRALYARTQEVDADLAGYFKLLPIVVPLGEQHVLVYNDVGTATIWTPASGVVYRRADLMPNTRPSLTPDGSALFVAGTGAMQRLNLPSRTWDDIDLLAALGKVSMPSAIAAIDATSFYACDEQRVKKITIDEQRRGTAAWSIDLPVPCTSVALTSSGSLIVGGGSFGLELGADGKEVRLYGPAGNGTVEYVYATKSAVILAHGGGTFVYRNGATEPQIIERGMDPVSLSPDGRWFIYSDVDNERLVVNDLSDGTSRSMKCVCLFADYYGPDKFLIDIGGAIEARSIDTLEPAGAVHSFKSQNIMLLTYLADGNMLLALRQSGLETIALLNDNPFPTQIVDGTDDLRTSLLEAHFTGRSRVLTRSLGPGDDALALLDTTRSGMAQIVAGADLAGISRNATPVSLAGGLFAVIDPLTDRFGYNVSIFDGETGKRLRTDYVLSLPALRRGDRFVGLETVDGLMIFDAQARIATAFPDGHFDIWDIEGDLFTGATSDGTSGTIASFQLGAGPPVPIWSQTVDRKVTLMCVTPSAGFAYFVRGAGATALLERRSISTGKILDTLEGGSVPKLDGDAITSINDSECDAASIRLRGYTGLQWRWDVAAKVLVSERTAATPPRSGDVGPVAVEDLAAAADARIGWDDSGAWLFDPSENRILTSFPSTGGRLSSELYLADRGLAVLGHESGIVEVWDVRAPSAAMISTETYRSPVIALDYDADRALLLSGDREGSINLWPLLSAGELIAAADRN